MEALKIKLGKKLAKESFQFVLLEAKDVFLKTLSLPSPLSIFRRKMIIFEYAYEK